jgi:DNA polymerase-3 subunit gamma/tau
LAKAVNCRAPQEGEPDNECDICLSVNEGRALDLVEIDAASNRGIDDIRNLSDKIRFTPNETRYKVYIIDEVHMLTEPAFNALLKTLEEPPAHAILVLATTEAHKVPLTVISRCQRFDFRRIPRELIVERLAKLCQDEGVEADADALALIARTSSGSLRDAENLLEQVVVSYGSPVTDEHVRDLLGLGGDEMALELVGHVINGSVKDGLTLVNQVAGQGNDLRQLHRGAMDHLRGVLLFKTNAAGSAGFSEDVTSRLKSLAGATSLDQLVHVLKSFARVDLRGDSTSPLPLELALVESITGLVHEAAPQRAPVAAAGEAGVVSSGAARVRSAEGAARTAQSSTGSGRRGIERDSPPSVVGADAVEPAARSEVVGAMPSGTVAGLDTQWGEIVRSLRQTGKRFKVGALLQGCKERDIADGTLTLKFPYRSHVERMQEELNDPETRKVVEEVLGRVMDGPYKLEVSLAVSRNDPTARRAANTSHLVRAAQAMGAHVVGQTEERRDEQENAPPGPAATTAHPEAPGGA